MPDTSSNVEILLSVRAHGQAALGEIQGQIAGLKAATPESAAATSVLSTRMQEAAAAGAATPGRG